MEIGLDKVQPSRVAGARGPGQLKTNRPERPAGQFLQCRSMRLVGLGLENVGFVRAMTTNNNSNTDGGAGGPLFQIHKRWRCKSCGKSGNHLWNPVTKETRFTFLFREVVCWGCHRGFRDVLWDEQWRARNPRPVDEDRQKKGQVSKP